MFNSLLWPLSRKNLNLFLTRESSVFSLLKNFFSNLNFRSNSLQSLFNSLRLLFGVEQNFRLSFDKPVWFLSNLYVHWLIILGFTLLFLFDTLTRLVFLFSLLCLKNGFFLCCYYFYCLKKGFLPSCCYPYGSWCGSLLLCGVHYSECYLTHSAFVGIYVGLIFFVCDGIYLD